MKKNILLIIIGSIFFQSCLSMKDMKSTKPISVNQENQKKLNGIYLNRPLQITNEVEGDDLRKLLFSPFHVYPWNEKRNFNGEIEIIQLTKKKIKVIYLEDGKPLKTKDLNGKFKNGFFLINRKVRPIGIPFIYYSYKERRIMIGLNDEDELIVKTGRYDFGMIFLFTGGSKNTTKYRFQKKKTSS